MTLQVVTGGQAGSEGKGAVAAYLASQHKDGLSVRVAGPNAGHTVIGRCPTDCQDSTARTSDPVEYGYDPAKHGMHYEGQHPWRLQQVPVAAVSNPDSMLAIAAGSEIDPEILNNEIRQLDSAGYHVARRLCVDPEATIIEPRHRFMETDSDLVNRIGSTGKGVGAARASRALRDAARVQELAEGHMLPYNVGRVAPVAWQYLRDGGDVLIEGTQGYLLGQHAGYYPQCTSSNCTATDFLSMAGIPPWLVPQDQLEIWVVFRTFPIRVAGNSGPLLGETSWEALGLPAELTTVTRKVRRVGAWDAVAARRAMIANGFTPDHPGPVRAALTMADQVIPELAGVTKLEGLPDDLDLKLHHLLSQRSSDLGSLIQLVGTGPASIIDLRSPERF